MRKNVTVLNRYMYREISLSDLCLDSLLCFENKVVEAAAKDFLPTVYQKHSSMRTRKRMYMG